MRVIQVIDERGLHQSALVPVERPLRIVLDGRSVVTLMTLGGQPELLVLGYLHNQRAIRDAAELASIDVDWDSGIATVASRAGLATHAGLAHESAADLQDRSACSIGSAFGDHTGWPGPPVLPPPSETRLSQATLLHLLAIMRERDAVHRAAGSVHSAALFAGGELLVSIEDVSRHNAIDTVTGWMALCGIAGGDKLLFCTGRLTAEMVLKAAHNGIALLVSRNGTTALGADIAARLRMTLITRAAGRRFTISVGAQRFDAEAADG